MAWGLNVRKTLYDPQYLQALKPTRYQTLRLRSRHSEARSFLSAVCWFMVSLAFCPAGRKSHGAEGVKGGGFAPCILPLTPELQWKIQQDRRRWRASKDGA